MPLLRSRKHCYTVTVYNYFIYRNKSKFYMYSIFFNKFLNNQRILVKWILYPKLQAVTEPIVQVSSMELVQEIHQLLMDREDTCHRTCFSLQLDGNTLDNFAELKNIEGLNEGSVIRVSRIMWRSMYLRMQPWVGRDRSVPSNSSLIQTQSRITKPFMHCTFLSNTIRKITVVFIHTSVFSRCFCAFWQYTKRTDYCFS